MKALFVVGLSYDIRSRPPANNISKTQWIYSTFAYSPCFVYLTWTPKSSLICLHCQSRCCLRLGVQSATILLSWRPFAISTIMTKHKIRYVKIPIAGPSTNQKLSLQILSGAGIRRNIWKQSRKRWNSLGGTSWKQTLTPLVRVVGVVSMSTMQF